MSTKPDPIYHLYDRVGELIRCPKCGRVLWSKLPECLGMFGTHICGSLEVGGCGYLVEMEQVKEVRA